MRRLGLVLVVIVAGLIFPAVYSNPPFGEPTAVRATPTLSGALPVEVPNGTFGGVGLGEVGTPPTNYDLETAGGTAGTPATNHDFSTGDFTGWTLTGTPVVESGYAKLTSGQKILSSAFTVDSAAQTLSFSAAAVNGGTFQWVLKILSGPTYGTTTTKFFTSCPTTCTNWNTYSIDAVPWRGQSIKVQVERYLGDLKVDDVAVGQVTLSSWEPTDGTKISRETGGPSDAYAKTTTEITTEAFTVDDDAQNGSVQLKVESGSYAIKVLSGTGYSTVTTVLTGNVNDSGSWGARSFGLGDFAGESIKLQIDPGAGSTIDVDSAGLSRHDVPGWAPAGGDPVALGSESGFPYLAHVGKVVSGTFHSSGDGYYGNTRGTWYRIRYRMYENYNSGGTDLGSTLRVYVVGEVSPQFTAVGKEGAPYSYDPTRVWIEKYFFVEEATAPYVVTPKDIQFRIEGWGPTVWNCSPSCGGRPDVALIEMVDGPGDSKVLKAPSALPALPPGVNVFLIDDPAGVETSDPVDVVSGNYSHNKTDLALPGRGVPMIWNRSYSAQAANSGIGVPVRSATSGRTTGRPASTSTLRTRRFASACLWVPLSRSTRSAAHGSPRLAWTPRSSRTSMARGHSRPRIRSSTPSTPTASGRRSRTATATRPPWPTTAATA